jgi:predicted polyphosphate/ATP-dependent NAD kinase
MAKRLGLIVNPIAGMGGRVGLKGTDTPEILEKARSLGAQPLCLQRTQECFLECQGSLDDVEILTCSGDMGAVVMADLGIDHEVVYDLTLDGETSSEDTRKAVEVLKEKADLLVFSGGDGTARDVAESIGPEIPILGIPAGVKMHSSVFGTNPVSSARIILAFLNDEVEIGEGEVMDIDEDAYREDRLDVKLYAVVKIPFAQDLIQGSKQVFHQGSQKALLDEIGDYFKEIVDEKSNTLFFLGAGSTVGAVKRWLGMDGTLLGIDAFFKGEQLGTDLNEQGILALMDSSKADGFAICVSPIGAQGFVLGRGSQQFSPEVLRRVGLDNVYIVATPDKVENLDALRVDTGDRELDTAMEGFRRVITGFRIQTMLKLRI